MTSQDQVKVLYVAARGRNTKCKLDSKRTAWVKMATGVSVLSSFFFCFVSVDPPKTQSITNIGLELVSRG